MKKIFNTMTGVVLAGGLLHASPYDSNDFDDEFRRMQHYINTVFNSHFSSSYRHGLYPKANFYDKNDQYLLEFELAELIKTILMSQLSRIICLPSRAIKNEKSKPTIEHRFKKRFTLANLNVSYNYPKTLIRKRLMSNTPMGY